VTSSYPLKPIRQVVERTALWSPIEDSEEHIRYIDVSAVSSEDLRIINSASHTPRTAPSRARKIVRANDTVFATIRPGLKRVAKVTQQFDGAVVSTAFCVLRPIPEEVDPDFLFFVVSSDSFVLEVADLQTGASYPAVRDKDVLDHEIPFPSLLEQRGIATVLRAVRASLSREIEMLKHTSALKQAAMRKLFTCGLHREAQELTNIGPVPASWGLGRLGDQADVISKGASPKWQGFDYVDSGVLFVRSQNVGNGRMEWSEKTFLPLIWNEKEKRSVLCVGDVLINLVGASIGRVAVGGAEIGQANCNQAVCFVRLRRDRMLPHFLAYFLLTEAGQMQMHSSKKDIARANLSLEDVRNFIVPLPPLDEQRDIAAIIAAIDHKIDFHTRKQTLLKGLFKSLLDKLMTGEIRVSDVDLAALEQSTADRVSA